MCCIPVPLPLTPMQTFIFLPSHLLHLVLLFVVSTPLCLSLAIAPLSPPPSLFCSRCRCLICLPRVIKLIRLLPGEPASITWFLQAGLESSLCRRKRSESQKRCVWEQIGKPRLVGIRCIFSESAASACVTLNIVPCSAGEDECWLDQIREKKESVPRRRWRVNP